jgi:hypothetical protein
VDPTTGDGHESSSLCCSVQVPWCETATRTLIQLPQRANATPICPNWKRGKQNLGVVGGGDFEFVAQVEHGFAALGNFQAQARAARAGELAQ